MYLAIILMPLIGSLISGFFGRKIGVKGSQFITCSLIILTAILAVLVFTEVGLNNAPVTIYLSRWVDLEYLNIFISFNFDSLTTLMLIPVLFVSSAVHIYSIGYMSHDPHNQRFFSYLSLFTFMMIILVTANNYLLMFVGWEGVGICSYLLVSFWFTRIAANQSSISAILTNRVGDCLLTVGMFTILWSLGNLDYATVFSLAPFINENIITIIGICLLIGAMAKSSQIGLHVWLPMAMEGPTPVSALIHAATMVTAGVYLLIRSSPLIEYSTTVLLLCLWIGATTSLFSSLIGLFQQDIKKVIAYSTMSQLGLMVLAIGLSSYNIALFHLINHAFYKALLFLGAGAVIHAVADKQDFRKYGGLKQFLPLSYSVMFIASLSLVAFPFMTGYFSKDFILESSYGKFYLSSIIVYYMATTGAMFTTLYSIKTLYLTFITNPNGGLVDYKNVHEGNIYMSLPLVILALFSIYFGFITKDMFIGLGSDLFIDNSIFIHPSNDIMINTEFAVPTIFKLLPFILTITLTVLSLLISEYFIKSLTWFKFNNFGYNIFSFFNLRFSIELIYNKYITEILLKLGGQTTRVLDKGAIELIGPYGLQNSIYHISKILSSLDTGVVTTYALYILIGGFMYICLPYILLSSLNILLILLLSIIHYKIKSNINKLDEPSNVKTTLESKINFKYYVIKIFRITIIAIILFYLRIYLITQYDLHRDLLADCIKISYISFILTEIIDWLWPTPLYHTLDNNKYIEKTTFNKLKPLMSFSANNVTNNTIGNSSLNSTANNSPSSSRSNSPPPITYVFPQQGQGLGPMGGPGDVAAFNNRDSLFQGTMGAPEDVRKFSTPMNRAEDLNDPERVICTDKTDPNGNLIGVHAVLEDADRNIVALKDISYIPGSNHRENNPVQRSAFFETLSRQCNIHINASIQAGTAFDAQGNETLEMRQLRYNMLFYAAKKREAWGLHYTMVHRDLLRMKLDDVNNQLTTPPENNNFPHNYRFPGTEPTPRN